MPYIKEFVDKVKETPIDNFEVQHMQGAPPVLHLYDEKGQEAADPISISQWKTEHILDFLAAKLASGAKL